MKSGSHGIDDILAEMREGAYEEKHDDHENMIETAYADRLEALCRKLYKQRWANIDMQLEASAAGFQLSTKGLNAYLDAELAAIARGDKGDNHGR